MSEFLKILPDKSMRILHIIGSMNPATGGPSQGIRQMLPYYASFGVTCEVVCLDDPESEWLRKVDAPCHAVGRGFLSYSYQPRLTAWLIENINRFDAFIIDGIWQYHSFAAWRVLQGCEKPYFIYTHGMLDPWFKKQYPLKHLKKWLYWPWADYRVLRDAAAVLFTCEEEMRLAPQSFWLYKASPRVVKFGASTPPSNAAELKEKFLSARPDLRSKRLLLFLSRIHEKKGCDILIEAFARSAAMEKDTVLVMAGPDSAGLVTDLRELATRLGVADRVVWVGMLLGDLKWGAFYASELFVLPSHQENFGIAVAEALGCGLPVLITNKVNIWREIEADGAGLVGDDTADATAGNLQRWFSLSPDEQAKFAVQARRTFDERFTAVKMTESLVSVIREFLPSDA